MNMKQFVKDRDEALLSLDKGKIVAYLNKYGVPIPDNETVFWAGVHKGITALNSATEEQKRSSYTWLIEHGFKGGHWIMSDTREKLIELLMQLDDKFCDDCGRERVGCSVVKVADHLIANGVTVQEWIPASEPPKEKGRYWCYVESFCFPGMYYQAVLKWDDGFIEGNIYTDRVTHWMPLPDGPKEG